MQRKGWLKNQASEYGAEAFLVTGLKNIRWLTGFRGSAATVLSLGDTLYFFTDRRYASVVENDVKNSQIHIYNSGTAFDEIKRLGLLDNLDRCLFESDDLSVAKHEVLVDQFDQLDFVGVDRVFMQARSVKAEDEVRSIKKAQQLADSVFDHLLEIIKPGLTEREISAEIVYQLLARGAEKTSFDPIVASGPNGALPHAHPSGRKLANGDLVVIDYGCVLEGYCSDMTRTICLGKANSDQAKAHQCVLDAMRSAIDHIREGRKAKDVDKVARDHISNRGYGRYFVHSTGHGVGLEIHEDPRISDASLDRLIAGQVITIEPGIYIPDQFGIRIEDLVHVTKTGSEVLTASPRELIII